jgi:riboflavin synthase
MFTGIVQSQGCVTSIKHKDRASQIVINVEHYLVDKLELGASIAINGVCLTVVEFSSIENGRAEIVFDVIDETLRVSNLVQLAVKDNVNVERSLKVGDEIGGHMVSGHVHCQAMLVKKQQTDTNCALTFSCQSTWMKYILAKGFITLNGISLTVGAVSDNTFTVHLIPETLARTNLATIDVKIPIEKEGDNFSQVNVEFDQQTMTIVTTLERMNLG